MKKIIVTGSLAYDRIMNFPQKFSDHILPDKIHNLNVCFQVDGVTENYGGTAGNIAYALKLMGEDPIISATIGRDYHNYFSWLAANSIAKEDVLVIDQELTAGAYITTDTGNNQITGFNPGAMKYSSLLEVEKLDPKTTLLLASPGCLADMIEYPKRCKNQGINYIFDPGQSLPMLDAEDLAKVVSGCMLLMVNDYEFNMVLEKTGLSRDELLKLPQATIITVGDKGSELYENSGASEVEKTVIPAATAAKVVDPTGCGDAYRGGVISGLLRGKSLKESALHGSICASFAVECFGTQEYSFTMEEFVARQKTI